MKNIFLTQILQIESRLPRSEKLRSMVRAGIPHSLRSHLWLRLSGAIEKRQQAKTSYKDIVKASSNDLLMTSKQIEKVWVEKLYCLQLVNIKFV